MTKHLLRILVASFMIAAVVFFLTEQGAQAEKQTEPSPYKTTLMLYMCGSNLESQFGSATTDITEIMKSGFDAEFTNVLLMVGGSKQWKIGMLNEKTSIVEVRKHGLRTVWSDADQCSMADGRTLSFFLNYCYENYPADRFALIIWDHGTGPNGGICYDELFDYRMMSLDGLRRALSNSPFGPGNKLNWIGFDACLMANVETAYCLQAYADYMIASQETEPSSGWNYAFLKDLEKDQSTQETANRIIDCYFDGFEGSKDILTLSCIDMSKIWNVTKEMDAYFEGLYTYLTNDTFSALSRERHQMKSFGRAEYDDASDWDLVDLTSLTVLNDTKWKNGQNLRDSIEKAVVLCRSNTEGANGLSVYHPCFNRALYSEWIKTYESMFSSASRSYVLYLRRFGQILTGNPLVGWGGMQTDMVSEKNGEIRFGLQLTDEQVKHYEHARLLVLQQIIADNELQAGFCRVWESTEVQMNENGYMTASYTPKALYVVDDETGMTVEGPIDCRITRDGQLQVCVLYMDENWIMDEDLLNVMYYFDFTEDSSGLKLAGIEVFDEATSSYSARTHIDQSFIDQTLYSYALFYSQNQLPTYKDEELIGYRDWSAGDSFIYRMISLPCSWHLEIRENPETPATLYALFELEDTQSVRHCSEMVRIFPEKVEEYEAVAEADGPDPSLEIYAEAQYYRSLDLFCVRCRISSDNLYLRGWQAENIVLNEERLLIYERSSAWDGADLIISMPHKQLLGTREIRDLSFDLISVDQDYKDGEICQVQIHFPVSILRDDEKKETAAVSTSDDRLIWTLRYISYDESTDKIYLNTDISNPSDNEKVIYLRDVSLESYVVYDSGRLVIPPHKTASIASNISMSTAFTTADYRTVTLLLEDLPGRIGIDSISSVRYYYTDESVSPNTDYVVTFRLAEPCPCRASELPTPTKQVTVLDGSEISLNLESCVTFSDPSEAENAHVTCLGVWLCNRAAYEVACSFEDIVLDGVPPENYYYYRFAEYTVPARTNRFVFLRLIRSVEKVPETVGFRLTTTTGTDEEIVFDPSVVQH